VLLFACNFIKRRYCNNGHYDVADVEQAANQEVVRIGRKERLDRVRRILWPNAFAAENPIDMVNAPNVEPNFDHVS
jgi:hypothetical protein